MRSTRPALTQSPQPAPAIWTVSGHRLIETFRAVGPEFSARASVYAAHLAFDEALQHLRARIAQQSCDVVVASGSSGAYLRSHLSVPVVLVKVGGFDLMAALASARALSERIAVVLHRSVSPELLRFAERFCIALELRAYETADDVALRIQELAGLGIEVVVGAGMVVEAAQRAGLNGVFLYSTDSVRDAIEDAITIAMAQRDQTSRHTQLDSVVRNLSDGVVAIDMAGNITTINPAAARLAGRTVEGATGVPLQRWFQGLSAGTVLRQGVAELGRVDELLGRSLVVDCVPLFDAGQQTGAVLTLHAPDALANAASRLRAHSYRRTRTARYTLDQLVAVSPAMQALVQRCRVLAQSEAAVLISGESGSGKEVVAQGMHEASARRQHPFVATNCAAFPESLLESELFGYEEGAFTGARRHGKAGLFEAANGGTLFLDEIGDMPLLLQTRLLRVLQEKEVTRVGGVDTIAVDVRIVAATNRDLHAMVREGRFREDLYYRVHILEVAVPPLRERPEDVQALTEKLLPAALERAGMAHLSTALLEQCMPLVLQHRWPGNVRELENVVERLAVECLVQQTLPAPAAMEAVLGKTAVTPPLKIATQDPFQTALAAAGGDRCAAAAALGISRTTLWRKLQKK
jgi:propionate catabolism operon transcriptional regulator